MQLKSYRIQVSNIMKKNIERALTAMGIVGVAGVVNRMAKGYYPTRKRDGSMNPQIRQTSALMPSKIFHNRPPPFFSCHSLWVIAYLVYL